MQAEGRKAVNQWRRESGRLKAMSDMKPDRELPSPNARFLAQKRYELADNGSVPYTLRAHSNPIVPELSSNVATHLNT